MGQKCNREMWTFPFTGSAVLLAFCSFSLATTLMMFFLASPSKMTLNHRAAQVVLVVKYPPAKAGDLEDMGSVPGSGISPGVGNAAHFNIIAWKNPLDRGAWWVTSHRVSNSWTRLK